MDLLPLSAAESSWWMRYLGDGVIDVEAEIGSARVRDEGCLGDFDEYVVVLRGRCGQNAV